MLTYIGLTIIIFSWLIELIITWRSERFLSPVFVFIYCLGVLLLVVDGYASNQKTLATMNLVSLLAAWAVFLVAWINKRQA